MMKHLTLNFDGTTSSVKRPILLVDPVRIIGMKVVCSTAQAGAATVSVGEHGAAAPVLVSDLEDVAALTTVAAGVPEAAGEEVGKTVFSTDKPLELDINLATAGKVSVVLLLDPFLIGQM